MAIGADLWLVVALARRSLEGGSLRGFWTGLRLQAGTLDLFTRLAATLVWLGVFPLVPLAAARRRRLTGRALEAIVRAVVAGVDPGTALDRGVAWLGHKGVPSDLARPDLERLLAGFLSVPPVAASEATRRRRPSGVSAGR